MDTAVIRKVIAEAESELAKVTEDLESLMIRVKPLNERKAQLESFLAQARAFLPGQTNGHHPAGSTRIGVAASDAPHWRRSESVILRQDRPMTVPEVIKALASEGSPINGKNATEVLRGAMIRKGDVFEAIGQGYYAIRSWPEEKKKIPNQLNLSGR